MVALGNNHAKPKDPTVNITSPTTPYKERFGKALTSIVVECSASCSEAEEDG
jgi:hypothetical protein